MGQPPSPNERMQLTELAFVFSWFEVCRAGPATDPDRSANEAPRRWAVATQMALSCVKLPVILDGQRIFVEDTPCRC
jgi:hypothetical protein